MTWFDLAAAVATAAAIVVLPGIALAAILGLRGLWAWGMAGPFGMTVVVLASLVAPMAGIAWGLLPVAAVFAVIAVGLVVARMLTGGLRRGRAREGGSPWVAVGTLAIAAALVGIQLVQVIGHPANISQTFDNIFHLNGIRYAIDTANASPLHLGSMTSDTGGVWFYPSAWHALGSLVVQTTGADIAVVANALAFLSSCVLWPAGAVLLTRTAFGASSPLLVAAGVFAAAVPAMPLLLLNYGVLYPLQLGLSLTPAALAATLALVKVGTGAPVGAPWIGTIAVLGALPALVIAHPGSFMAWLVFASIAVLVAFVGFVRTRPARRSVVLASIGFAAFVAVALVAWRVLKPPVAARTWEPTLSLGQAIGEAMTLSFWSGGVPVVVVAALIAGIVVCARRRRPIDMWVLVAFASASLLYITAIGLPWPTLRDLLTASWYNNAPRLAAIVPIVVIPLAALGAASVWGFLRARKPIVTARGAARAAWAGGLIVLLIVTTQAGAMRAAVHVASAEYALTPDSRLVSTDEMTLLRRLPGEVPEDAVIAGSPWTGTGLAYALAGREVLMPHTLMDIDDDMELINDRLDEADRYPTVCAALERTGVEYVLDFGTREVHGAKHPFPGMDQLRSSDAVTLVDSEGSAALYRIVACEATR